MWWAPDFAIFEPSDVKAGDGELYQLYVRRGAQGLRLGEGLFTLALAHLATERPGPTWLGVESGNDKVQAFYATRGFTPVGGYRFHGGARADEVLILRRG